MIPCNFDLVLETDVHQLVKILPGATETLS